MTGRQVCWPFFLVLVACAAGKDASNVDDTVAADDTDASAADDTDAVDPEGPGPAGMDTEADTDLPEDTDVGPDTDVTPITLLDLPTTWAQVGRDGMDCAALGGSIVTDAPAISGVDATQFNLVLGATTASCALNTDGSTATELAFDCVPISYSRDFYQGGAFACFADMRVGVHGTASLTNLTLNLDTNRNAAPGPAPECSFCVGVVISQAVPAR